MNIEKELTEKEIEISNTLDKLKRLKKEHRDLMEKSMAEDDNYIRVDCPNCDGKGYTKEKDKKELCSICNGKQYVWAKVFEE